MCMPSLTPVRELRGCFLKVLLCRYAPAHAPIHPPSQPATHIYTRNMHTRTQHTRTHARAQMHQMRLAAPQHEAAEGVPVHEGLPGRHQPLAGLRAAESRPPPRPGVTADPARQMPSPHRRNEWWEGEGLASGRCLRTVDPTLPLPGWRFEVRRIRSNSGLYGLPSTPFAFPCGAARLGGEAVSTTCAHTATAPTAPSRSGTAPPR